MNQWTHKHMGPSAKRSDYNTQVFRESKWGAGDLGPPLLAQRARQIECSLDARRRRHPGPQLEGGEERGTGVGRVPAPAPPERPFRTPADGSLPEFPQPRFQATGVLRSVPAFLSARVTEGSPLLRRRSQETLPHAVGKAVQEMRMADDAEPRSLRCDG